MSETTQITETPGRMLRRLHDDAHALAMQASATARQALEAAWDAGQIVAHAMDDGATIEGLADESGVEKPWLLRYRQHHARRRREELGEATQMTLFCLPEDDRETKAPARLADPHGWLGPLEKFQQAWGRTVESSPISAWSRPDLERARAYLRPMVSAFELIERRLDEQR